MSDETGESKLRETDSFSPAEKELLGHAVAGELERTKYKVSLCFYREPDSLTPDESALRQSYLKGFIESARREDKHLSEHEVLLNAKETLNVQWDKLDMLSNKLQPGEDGPLNADELSDDDLGLLKWCIYAECQMGDTARNTYTPEHDGPRPLLAYEALDDHIVDIYNARPSEADDDKFLTD